MTTTPTPLSDAAVYDVPVADLNHYPGNARKGNVDAIAESLAHHGQYRPVVVRREDATVLAGNHTLLAAKALGWETVKVTYLDGLTDDAARRIVLVDNKTNDLAEYDDRALIALLEELGGEYGGTGYTDEDLLGLIDGLEDDEPVALTDPDEVPLAPETPKSKPGDVWILGVHRLVVGDSTDPAALTEALDGNPADLVVTDPPYNVDYANVATAAEAKARRMRTDGLTIKNDSMSAHAFRAFLDAAFEGISEALTPGCPFYVFYADRETDAFWGSLENAGLPIKQTLVWVKSSMILSRSDYHWQHEPLLYGWKPGAAHRWYGGFTPTTLLELGEPFDPSKLSKADLLAIVEQAAAVTTVIRADKPSRNAIHPTAKPVELLTRLVENSSKPGDWVLDPFGGSGATLIACHGTKRRAALVELDPKYADVICRRYQEHTGTTPVLEATGQEHDFTTHDAAA